MKKHVCKTNLDGTNGEKQKREAGEFQAVFFLVHKRSLCEGLLVEINGRAQEKWWLRLSCREFTAKKSLSF